MDIFSAGKIKSYFTRLYFSALTQIGLKTLFDETIRSVIAGPQQEKPKKSMFSLLSLFSTPKTKKQSSKTEESKNIIIRGPISPWTRIDSQGVPQRSDIFLCVFRNIRFAHSAAVLGTVMLATSLKGC